MSRFLPTMAALSLFASPLLAQDHVHPQTGSGEKLGIVNFPTSCSPGVTPVFNRAVALLHSFEFGAAIKGFEQVLAADSTCAIAHWGIALSRWSNPMAAGSRAQDQLRRGRASVEAATRFSSRATDRERAYIAAVAELYKDFESVNQHTRVVAYERAMADLAAKQADDMEAKIFYAISLVGSALPTDKTYANQRKAGEILVPLWAKHPNHPGLAHYIIHTYDYPALAAEGSAAALSYASIAPSAAHAQHMPSHIFTRTGLWKESIATNLKSMDIALSTSSIAETLHAADYAAYAYLQLRRYPDAKGILDRLPELRARFDVNAITGAAPGWVGVFALAAIPARYALERDAWGEAASLEATASASPWTEGMTYFARAIGASRMKDFAKARVSIDSLASIRDRLATRDDAYWTEQIAIQHLGAQAWLDLGEGRVDSALAKMRRASLREDATEKSAATPGPLFPSREMLGDMLMQLNRPKEALAEYRATLVKEPNRYRSMAGAAKAAVAAGDPVAAKEYQTRLDSIRE